METIYSLKASIRRWIVFFVITLILSGATAFALESELAWLCTVIPKDIHLFFFIQKCYVAIKDMNAQYPFLAYGYDWLAFAHIVIAVAFIGPYRDPVKNIWIIQFGCIACILIWPTAFIAGHVRQIPLYWKLIDCSFGVIGLVPLLICYKKIKRLEVLENIENQTNLYDYSKREIQVFN
ncbi:hypothetical protein [Pinibacter aurantiacus]|uniref:Uncharacterized protein n=1 Tax=Pinibacter aurantiacus TaxID=2851599 RepID=A0A9E2S348_9BACT|nr:hypothetical protein [Pinibacter aurantiacus]MBV4355733.1 hypothetical protein [Pinibacter aurantiacus]